MTAWLGRVQPSHPSAMAGSAPAPQPFPSSGLQSPSWSCTSEPAELGGLWDWEWLGLASVEPQHIWMGSLLLSGHQQKGKGLKKWEERQGV